MSGALLNKVVGLVREGGNEDMLGELAALRTRAAFIPTHHRRAREHVIAALVDGTRPMVRTTHDIAPAMRGPGS